jgi:hypothetical protein
MYMDSSDLSDAKNTAMCVATKAWQSTLRAGLRKGSFLSFSIRDSAYLIERERYVARSASQALLTVHRLQAHTLSIDLPLMGLCLVRFVEDIEFVL